MSLQENPELLRIYEQNAEFSEAIDDMMICFDSARESLSDEEYLEFLKYSLALFQEWKT